MAKNNAGNYYKINLDMDVDKVVNLIDQSRNLTKISLKNRPKSVYKLDTQNLGNKEKQSIRQINDLPGDNSGKENGELQKMKADLCKKLTLPKS